MQDGREWTCKDPENYFQKEFYFKKVDAEKRKIRIGFRSMKGLEETLEVDIPSSINDITKMRLRIHEEIKYANQSLKHEEFIDTLRLEPKHYLIQCVSCSLQKVQI